MNNTIGKGALVSVLLLGLSSGAVAVEIAHNAFTSLCLSSGQIHGRCVTTHSDGNSVDTRSLGVDCKLDRNGNIIGSRVYTINDVGSHGNFTESFNLILFGRGANQYCARNRSKYFNIWGTALLGQPTGTSCKTHGGGSGGGPKMN